MPKPVKKKKTTYEAFVWDGENDHELEDLDIQSYEAGVNYFKVPYLTVYFYDRDGDYQSADLSVGDAIVKSSNGKIWFLNKYDYKEKFEDA